MPLPFAKDDQYLPVRMSTEKSEDEGDALKFSEAQMEYRKPEGRWRNWAFLIIPAAVSAVTALVLLFVAGSLSDHNEHKNAAAVTTAVEPQVAVLPHASGYQGYQPLSYSQAGLHCGSTAAEARSRGCIFDTISFAWLMPECYDAELVEQFSHIPYKFDFFTSKDNGVAYPWSEVQKGERMMYVPWAHHLWHCGYLFKKMHRAIMAGKPVDSYIGNMTHTEHCMHLMIVENIEHDLTAVNTIMELKFPYCGPGNLQWTGGTNFTKTHPELAGIGHE